MLSGLLNPTSGDARVLGFVPWERRNEMKRQFSLLMGQKNALWWDLPAQESLELNRAIYGIERDRFKKVVDGLSELLEVQDKMNVMVRELSLGERMKMELISALIHEPRVLFLDEPTIGLDVVSQKRVREFLRLYNSEHRDRDHADESLHAGHRGAVRSRHHHRSRQNLFRWTAQRDHRSLLRLQDSSV